MTIIFERPNIVFVDCLIRGCSPQYGTIIFVLVTGDLVMPNKGRRVTMRIMHRYHFSSALKRMSSVVSVQAPGSSVTDYIATVKGAPETLRSMVSHAILWHFVMFNLT